MKKIANSEKASTDDIYYVSAADVADKIIERMRCGLEPRLFFELYAGSYPREPVVEDCGAEQT